MHSADATRRVMVTSWKALSCNMEVIRKQAKRTRRVGSLLVHGSKIEVWIQGGGLLMTMHLVLLGLLSLTYAPRQP